MPASRQPRSSRQKSAAARAKKLQLMLFDVDGVLTDGMLYLGESGELMKAFNAQDGHGLKMLAESGVEVGILSSRRSPIVAARARELGITLLLQGEPEKGKAFAKLLAERDLTPDVVGFMGDDVLDLPVLIRCGFAASVPAAPALVKANAHWVAKSAGGAGAAREVCEFIMRAQKRFDAAMRRYLA